MENLSFKQREFMRFDDARKENGRMIDNFVYAGATGIVGILILNFKTIITHENKIYIIICLFSLIIAMSSHFISYLFAQKQAEYFIDSLHTNEYILDGQKVKNSEENKKYNRNINLSNSISYASIFLSFFAMLISVMLLIQEI